MISYSFNGVTLPALPEATDYPYAVISTVIDASFEYALMYETKPFKHSDSEVLFDLSGEWLVYVCNSNSTQWRTGSIDTSASEGDRYSIIDPDRNTFLWCNEDIADLTSGEIIYAGTAIVETLYADTPKLSTNFPPSGKLIYNKNKTAKALTVSAKIRDEGILSYQWYCGEEAITNATTDSYMPSTSEISSKNYCCKVTNTLEEPPVAYLYNGVRLLDINRVWTDKAAYPYAYIYTGFGQCLILTSKPLVCETSEILTGRLMTTETTKVCAYEYYSEGFKLSYEKELDSDRCPDQRTTEWANVDVYSTDGTLVLAASEPLPVYTEYLYNDIKLPALPEWDMESYITKHQIFGITKYKLHLTSAPYYATASDGSYCIGYRMGDTQYDSEESNWVYSTTYEQNGVFTELANVIWANFNVLDENGDIYVAASEPVPVLTTYTAMSTTDIVTIIVKKGIHEKSLFYGWLAGQKVANSRCFSQLEPAPYRYKLGLLTGTTEKKSPSALHHTNTWVEKNWGGDVEWSNSDLQASNIWSDGINIYYSRAGTVEQVHCILNGDTWVTKAWNLTTISGSGIWSDGTNIYYSSHNSLKGDDGNYVLNGDTWEAATFEGLTEFNPMRIWSDGERTYYSYISEHYVLNGNTWEKLNWNINVHDTYTMRGFWSDGTNIYYSNHDEHYVLNGDTWETKTWNVNFWTTALWTDGTNIYLSRPGYPHYILKDGIWEKIELSVFENFSGSDVWSDGTNIYYSDGADQYVLM